jgi:hypothetical protein
VVSATSRPLYPRKETQYLSYRRLGGPRGRSGQVRKISPPLGFNPWTVQVVAYRYTNWAIAAHSLALEASEWSSLRCRVRFTSEEKGLVDSRIGLRPSCPQQESNNESSSHVSDSTDRLHACLVLTLIVLRHSSRSNTEQQLRNTKTPSVPHCAVLSLLSDRPDEPLHIRATGRYWRGVAWRNKTRHASTTYDKLWDATQVKTWTQVSNFVH